MKRRRRTTALVVVTLAIGAVAVLGMHSAVQDDLGAASGVGALAASGASATFLQIAGIPGESTDSAHKDWIDVDSVRWGFTSTRATAPGSSGRATLEDFTISKPLDKSSPKLYLNCGMGAHINEVVLEQFSGGKREMQIKLSDAIVTAVTGPGPLAANGLPAEEVRFTFGKIEWTYTEYDAATGRLKGDVKTYWDFTMNRGG